jgi:hypothetical protein
LAFLKSYVWNRAHPKGSIMKRYTTEEVVECYTDYVKDGKRICLSIPLHEGRLIERGRMGQKIFVDRNYNSVRHISVYYNNSRLLHRILRNTCCSFAEITYATQKHGIL